MVRAWSFDFKNSHILPAQCTRYFYKRWYVYNVYQIKNTCNNDGLLFHADFKCWYSKEKVINKSLLKISINLKKDLRNS